MTPTPRIAVTSRSFSRHPMLREELRARFPDVTFNTEGHALSGDALVAFLRGHDRAIVALERLDAATLAQLPELRVISKYGVGLDGLDLAAMEARGIRLGWKRGTNARSVAEVALAGMIALLHRFPDVLCDVRAGRWRQTVGRQLSGRTVGIIGCGHVGGQVVALLRPFDCRVLVHDIRDLSGFCLETGVTQVSLEDLLATADVVSVHLPLDGRTRRLIDGDRLTAMKPGAVLVNTARGGIVDDAALAAAVRRGHLAGAFLDVLECEPDVDRDLLDLPSVMITPHIGGSADEAILMMGRAAIDGLEAAHPPSTLGLVF